MIKLSQASLDECELRALKEVLDENYLGMGKFVNQFENDLKDYFENKTEVVCVNTGTSALHLALQALGLQQNDEVLVPTITYVACFQAISATGAIPVACDVYEENCLLDISSAEQRVTSNTKAILLVHYAGNVTNLEKYYEFAQKYNLRVVEDAAHSFGSNYKGRKVGSFGDIICFSFDSIKNITCGEGGAIMSTDRDVIEKVKTLRLLGVEKDTDARFNKTRLWDFEVHDQGWRYHMSNLNAAIGSAQLKKLFQFKKIRQRLASIYVSNLISCKKVIIFDIFTEEIIPHIFPMRIKNGFRDELRIYLNKRGIETGLHYKPNHLLLKFKGEKLTNSETLWKEILTLPLHCNLDENDVHYICSEINNFFIDK